MSARYDGIPLAKNVVTVLTFSEAAKVYLKEPLLTRKRLPLKPSSVKDRVIRINVLAEIFGATRLKNLTWGLVCQQIEKQGWSPASRYRYESALSRFFVFCKRQKWMAYNIAEGQERADSTKRRERTYTSNEWDRLLDAADQRGDMLAMFLRLARATGARKSELLNLRWANVSEVEHDDLGASLYLRETKTNENRKVFVGKDLYRLLKAHEQEFRRPSSDLVFPARTKDGRYKVDSPFRKARAASKLDTPDPANGETLTVHHIRHTWATNLADSGASLAQLMAAGGWKTPQMAARYFKTKESQSAEAAYFLPDPCIPGNKRSTGTNLLSGVRFFLMVKF